PLARRIRMTEEFNLHLLKLARAERKIPRRNLVTETLAHLGNAEWNPDARTVEHILEVHEDALGGFRTQKRGILLRAHRADDRLEHQIEFARLGECARLAGLRSKHFAKVVYLRERNNVALPGDFVCFLRSQFKELLSPLGDVLGLILGDRGNEHLLPLILG